MTETTDRDGQAKRPRGALGLALGGALALAAGAGSYLAVAGGHLPAPLATLRAATAPPPTAPWEGWAPPAFVAMEPMVVSLGARARARHLSVALALEVEPGAEAAVEAALPQVRAALGRFLRAVDERDFETPGLMLRLQAQMERRARLAAPPGTLRGLLVQDFVLK